jgi:hypothetical protein
VGQDHSYFVGPPGAERRDEVRHPMSLLTYRPSQKLTCAIVFQIRYGPARDNT